MVGAVSLLLLPDPLSSLNTLYFALNCNRWDCSLEFEYYFVHIINVYVFLFNNNASFAPSLNPALNPSTLEPIMLILLHIILKQLCIFHANAMTTFHLNSPYVTVDGNVLCKWIHFLYMLEMKGGG